MYELPGCQQLYQVMCPDRVFNSFFDVHNIRRVRRGTDGDEGKAWALSALEVMLAPSREMFAVIWDFCLLRQTRVQRRGRQADPLAGDTRLLGLSIHSAMSGEAQHSMFLTTTKASSSLSDWQVRWLPSRSCITFINSNGVCHLITSSGQLLWTVSSSDRTLALPKTQARHSGRIRKLTRVCPSPCGRWILIDDQCRDPGIQGPPGDQTARHSVQVAVVQASSGSIVECHEHEYQGQVECSWSQSGDACLLHQSATVLVLRPGASAVPTFQHFKLPLSGSDDSPPRIGGQHTDNILGLSPCESTVIDYQIDFLRRDRSCLQHWQLPSASAARSDDAESEQCLYPSVCAELARGSDLDIGHAAWHPLQNSGVYALADQQHGVHFINAKTNTCFKSWRQEELQDVLVQHGAAGLYPNSCDDDRFDDEPNDKFYQKLRWSSDGCKLAVASPARCIILSFSGSFT